MKSFFIRPDFDSVVDKRSRLIPCNQPSEATEGMLAITAGGEGISDRHMDSCCDLSIAETTTKAGLISSGMEKNNQMPDEVSTVTEVPAMIEAVEFHKDLNEDGTLVLETKVAAFISVSSYYLSVFVIQFQIHISNTKLLFVAQFHHFLLKNQDFYHVPNIVRTMRSKIAGSKPEDLIQNVKIAKVCSNNDYKLVLHAIGIWLMANCKE